MIFAGDVLLYILTGLAHWAWAANLSMFGVSPNIVFAAALSAAVLAGPAKAVAYGFFFGVYLDIFGSGLFGAYALVYTLMAYLVQVLKRHFDLAGGLSQIIAAYALSLLAALFYQSLSLVFAGLNPASLRAFFAEPFLNAALAPFVFYVFARFKKGFGIL